MTKVALLYGVLTGPKVGAGFRNELKKQGYSFTSDIDEADIIVCHSGGCYSLPDTMQGKSLLLINPPYWPGKSGKERAWSRARSYFNPAKHNYNLKQWLWRSFWGTFYGITQPRHHAFMARAVPKHSLEPILTGNKVIIIRNQYDDWITPDLEYLTSKHQGLEIVELPWDHDDCWINPAPYVAALKKLQ